MPRRNTTDELTTDKRIRAVLEWVLNGFLTKDIIAQAKLQWGVEDRMAYYYLKGSKKLMAEARKGKINERIDFYLSAKLKLYNELKDKDTPKGAAVANDILDSMARLEGAVVDKLDITSKGKKIKPEAKIYKTTLNLS